MDELEEKRRKLRESTEEFKLAIEDQVEDLKEGAIKWAFRGIVAVGFSVLSYYLIRRLTRKPAPNYQYSEAEHTLVAQVKEPNPLVTSIKVYIATFLLGIARDLIVRYLEKTFAELQTDESEYSTTADSFQENG
jgi:hypothetical protein